MSIIHDALKKAGADKSGLKPQSPGPRLEIQRRPAGRLNGGLLLVVVLLLAAGAFVLQPLSRGLNISRQPASPGLTLHSALGQPGSGAVSGQFGIEEIATAGAFHLSGVVVSPSGSYGIINNQIVAPGQVVSGATVRSINDHEVSLDYNGQTLVLPVKDAGAL